MNLTLYTIAEEIRDILTSEEWTEEQCSQLDKLEMQLEAKADNCLMFVDNMDAAIDAHKKEEARLSARRKSMENRRDRIKEYLFNCMEAIDRTEIDLVTRKAVIQKNPPAVVVDDESRIPARYFVTIPESFKLDKKALAAALKLAPVDGAHLEQGKSLRIK
jgi:hypothetical protein